IYIYTLSLHDALPISRGKRHRIPQEELDYIVSRTDVVRLLDEFGLFASGQLRIRGNRVVGKCVMPHHPNPDNPTAFNFDIKKKRSEEHTSELQSRENL